MRRAVIMAAGDQYYRLAIGFVSVASTSRLLTPSEIGVSVIGTGIMAIALGLREFATSDFLIQRREVLREDIRTSFTVLFLLTASIVGLIFLLAPWFGTFYGEERLARFLRVAAVGGLIETIPLPIIGCLRRDMAFGALATINVASVTVMTMSTVVLALLGFSYMSFAWAAVAGAATTAAAAFFFRPDPSILRPTLRSWTSVVGFGGYNGASFLINRIYEALPQLVLARILPHSAVGLYARATLVSDIPDRLVLSSVFSVAFPALAAEIRRGGNLKAHYLRALSLITVVYWPGQALLCLLAYPIVTLLLGQQWLEVIPLLQIMAIAGLAWFAVVLTSPVLLAIGANRDRVMADLIGRSVSAVILCSSAWFGILAMAASKLVTLPFQMMVSFCFVRRHLAFGWIELAAALSKSAVVTAVTMTGPVAVLAFSEWSFDLSLGATALVAVLATTGWLIGVLMTRHPVLLEASNVAQRVVGATLALRLRGRASA